MPLDFTPHGMCLLWDPSLMGVHIGADATIALAYLVISFLLFILQSKLSTGLTKWAFCAFATFILTCGMTHVMDIIVLWYPLYWLQALVKVACALSSGSTAFFLTRYCRGILRNKEAIKLVLYKET